MSHSNIKTDEVCSIKWKLNETKENEYKLLSFDELRGSRAREPRAYLSYVTASARKTDKANRKNVQFGGKYD